MAWWTIDHSCGHSVRIQLYGPEKDREAKAEWMGRGVCPDCYREQKEQERRQENERAATLVADIGFSLLSGSEKQVAWANSIRQKVYEAMVSRCRPENLPMLAQAISLETSAKWWIDNRTKDPGPIMSIIKANYSAKAAEIEMQAKEAQNAA